MADITWSELVPPPLGCALYHIAIGRSVGCPAEDYQLHVYRFPDQEEEAWHSALYLPVLSGSGRLAEYYKKHVGGSLDEAKQAIESDYQAVAEI